MHKSELGWNKTAVWICTKCKAETSIAEDTKKEFKSRLKELGLSSKVRVMTSSCLGLCPENLQAVVIVSPQSQVTALECQWPEDKEVLFERIKSQV
ncbi:MAG: hypothetical protein ACK5V3_00585 [Bdellovibrionales bacterium]